MIKGLGHLIRTMFGGRQAAPAQPPHMVGAVKHDLVAAPAASDDVLRKAMEAASEVTLHSDGISGRVAQYVTGSEDGDTSLPTLFLHGKPSTAVETGFTPRLESLMTFQEIVEVPPRVSETVLALAEPATVMPDIVDVPEATPVEETITLSWVPPTGDAPAPKKSPAGKKASTTTAKRKKAGKVLPADAVFLTDAVIWSQCGSWREFWLPPTDPDSSQRVAEFHARAAAGELTVWGRTGESDDYVAIAVSHWKKAGFDPLAFLAGRENAFSQAPPSKSRAKTPAAPVKYMALKVSRREVETLFGTQGETAVA